MWVCEVMCVSGCAGVCVCVCVCGYDDGWGNKRRVRGGCEPAMCVWLDA